MMTMMDNDLTAMDILMSTMSNQKSTVVSLVPPRRRAKRKSEKDGQKIIKNTASDRGYATGDDYDRIIANPHLEKKFRENRKFLEVVFDAQSVNLITPHKVYA